MSAALENPLDNAIWQALTTTQRHLAVGNDRALRYDTDYAPFAAMPAYDQAGLTALASIIPANGAVALFTLAQVDIPDPLVCRHRAELVQMIAGADPVPHADLTGLEIRPLGPPDEPAMANLVTETKPGPFAARTARMGTYIGAFDGPTLVAMAGERMRLPGHVEISAVCTHPSHRRRGLGQELVARMTRKIRAEAQLPYLHVFAANTPAIELYQGLGFVVRAPLHLAVLSAAGA